MALYNLPRSFGAGILTYKPRNLGRGKLAFKPVCKTTTQERSICSTTAKTLSFLVFFGI